VQTYRLRQRFFAAFAALVAVVLLCGVGAVWSSSECRRQIDRLYEFQRSARAASSDADRIELQVRIDQARDAAARETVDTRSMAIGSCLLAGVLAIAMGRHLWRSVATSLRRLSDAAIRVGQGDTAARVGPLEAEELAAVGMAFDSMLDRLASSRASLLEAERLAAIGRMAAGVAHEINNPIGIIRGYLKTMRRDAPSEPLSKELAILDEEAAACQRIADDLLACARPPALHREDLDLAELIEESITRAQNGDAAFVDRVRVGVSRAVLSVDRLRMRQIVSNLVRNALEASPPESPVEVEGRVDGKVYRITVLDRGPGIPPEARERVFEPFFTTRRAGTGLGLAVSRGLAVAHGGTLIIEDREGGGLRVVVKIPIRTTGA
jgi:signal transduction histidine kinase